MRPVTTQIWRLLTLSSSPIQPPCFPKKILSGFSPLKTLASVLPHHSLGSTFLFYSSRHSPLRFRPSTRPSQANTSLPPAPAPPRNTPSASTKRIPLRDAPAIPSATRATHAAMSSDSEDDVPLSRFGRGKCISSCTRLAQLTERRCDGRVTSAHCLLAPVQPPLEWF